MVAGVALPQNPNSAPFRFSLGYHNITIPGDRSHHAPVPKHVIIDRDKDDNEYYTRLFANRKFRNVRHRYESTGFLQSFRGFTKQCCNLISYGVVFLWGNDLETQVLNKLTSRFILSNNSIQIYEISDKKSKYDFYYSIYRFMADISVTVDHFFLWADWNGLERT